MEIFGVCIGDIHFGINNDNMNPLRLKYELDEVFIKFINEAKSRLDFIAIVGDLFDRKINLTESSSKIVINFINNLADICNDNNIELILIKGTKSHDNDQLDNFRYLEKYHNFRIYNSFDIINIKGNRILILPEEYMENEDMYYKNLKDELKNNPVDMIFGHGTFDVEAFQNQILESERNIKGSPVYKYKEWEEYTHGPIIFGHIHVRKKHHKLYYTGSYTRWCYGEDENKGFIIVKYNPENKEYKVKFMDNNLAMEYKTISLSKVIKEDSSIEEKVKTIQDINKDNPNLRIKIDMDIRNDEFNILKDSIKDVKIIKENYNFNNKLNEYSFLSSELSLEENIKNYIKYKYDKDFTLEKIKDIIHE